MIKCRAGRQTAVCPTSTDGTAIAGQRPGPGVQGVIPGRRRRQRHRNGGPVYAAECQTEQVPRPSNGETNFYLHNILFILF